MFTSKRGKRRFGFTLVEVLVTTVVVGTMAAVVVPAMIKLAPAGDPARIASDLGSVKAAIDVFAQDLRPLTPGDVEDLVNQIETTDKSLDNAFYRTADSTKWKGPYLQWTVDETATDAGTVKILKTAAGVQLASALYRCPAASSNYSNSTTEDGPCVIYTSSTSVTDPYIAMKLFGVPAPVATVPGTEFEALNDVIDGKDEASSAIKGLLRQNASGTVFFFAAPYTAP